MIKRTIDISEGPTFLCIQNDQLVLQRDRAEVGRIPCEDIGLLLVDHRATTYTHAALVRLIHHGAAVALCGEDHLPAGLLLPLADNGLHTERLRGQVAASAPLKKNLWRQIVKAKIAGQAANLPADHPARRQLLDLAAGVRSGDTSNAEGVAATFYWRALMGAEFRRDPEGAAPNGLLNYGYMVFRAAVARALVAGGLHPALGLHHSNRANPFCLADDLLEPLRPLIDRAVRGLMDRGIVAVDQQTKRELLSLLTVPAAIAGAAGPLMVGLHRMVASLVRCYAGETRTLELPTFDLKDLRATDPEEPG